MMKWLGKDSVQTKVNSKPTSIIANHNTFLKPFNSPPYKLARISIYSLNGGTLWCTLKFIHHEKQNNTLPLHPG